MAEEAHYSSGPDSAPSSNKRKFEHSSPPSSATAPPRRATGFSAPIPPLNSSSSPPTKSSYNSVPPPADEFELAKQRAQEIAARLFNAAAADPKRTKVDNGGPIATGFDSPDASYLGAGQKPLTSSVTPPAYGFGFGHQGSKKIDIPNGRVGVIIGKGGETIKYLQTQSGAKIQVTRDAEADPYSATRTVELSGNPDEIAKAEKLIQDVLAEAETGGSGTVSRRVYGEQPGSEKYVSKIPNNKVGLVIGKGGETIKNMQATTGARIQVIPLHLPPGDMSTERTLQIEGSSEQIEHAKKMVEEVISENRVRNPSMGGGYNQQSYQARPPTSSWGPPGPPMQQSGYGYMQQQGAYPTGQTPQYNTSQQQYPGYPPQPATGGYGTTGWDQTNAAPTQQMPQGSAGYDSTGGYGYPQAPASGYNQQAQGYTQDGYGYSQPQGNPTQGYDQQQQGYGTASGYGGGSGTTTDGNPPAYGGAQGDTSQVPPPVQPAAAAAGQQGYSATTQQQPSYGAPPTSSQPGYGTQPPAAGYGQTYGQTTSGQYAQPDPTTYRAPPAAYGASAAQPGYGAPPAYGAPPMTQQGYGQPPPYNSSYGGGYPQAQTYSADGNAAAPTAQAVPPSGVAKASPQS